MISLVHCRNFIISKKKKEKTLFLELAYKQNADKTQ